MNQIEDNFIQLEDGFICRGCGRFFKTVEECNEHLDELVEGSV